MTTGVRPLETLRVLDLSRLYPGAMCTLLLADLGADVVKIEAPGYGDGMRFVTGDAFPAAHVAFNRGKRSVTLDLRQPAGADVLRRLVATADVVVESHRPGALDAIGAGYDAMRADNPGLIWCSVTGFGHDSPLAAAPGHDLTYLGYAAVLGLLGGTAPPVPDVVLSLPLGALVATVGILAALNARHTTGTGAWVDASLVDAAMWPVAEEITRAAHTGREQQGWGAFASRATYRCADGRFVTVAASEPKPWRRLCDALGLPELADHALGDDEAGVTARLAAVFATKPAADWVREPGLDAGIGPVHTPTDLLTDHHVAARHGLIGVRDSDAVVLRSPVRVRAPGTTADPADGRVEPVPPAPALGEHTDAVLAEAGFAPDEIASLRDVGVV
jgi:crotonobetainyl-CoA:carnitine CoA-transferase CaiB-like acyl-CoA transferase